MLAEIEKLDAKLRANADYLVNDLELYRHIRRDEPEEYWWWYLDGPLETREMIGEMWQVSTEAVPVAMVAEERVSYEEQPSNE